MIYVIVFRLVFFGVQIPPNVNPALKNVAAVALSATLPAFDYLGSDARSDFYEQAVERIGEIPGVQSAGATVVLPLAEGNGQYLTR